MPEKILFLLRGVSVKYLVAALVAQSRMDVETDGADSRAAVYGLLNHIGTFDAESAAQLDRGAALVDHFRGSCSCFSQSRHPDGCETYFGSIYSGTVYSRICFSCSDR